LCTFSSPTITDCILTANKATNGGAISCEDSNAAVINCIITGNTATRGGAISFRKGAPKIISTTVANNFAEAAGGGIFAWRSTETITNSIIYNNLAPATPQLHLNASPDYCCIQNWTGAGKDNIDTDPCFVAPGFWADANNPHLTVEPNDPNAVWVPGDYHLLPTSPCINAADPNYPNDPNQTDIDHQPRIFAGRLDIGADEFVPTIHVPVKFTPQSLNPASSGNYVKAHLVLPEGFAPDDLDTNTPLTARLFSTYVESDYINVFINEDSLVEIEAAFDRTLFCHNGPAEGTVKITGLLTDGRYLVGTDTVKIINKTFQHLAVFASHWLRDDCGPPDWCGDFDLDRNAAVNFLDFAAFDACCIEITTK
jgi:hypothetical protein